MREAFYELLDHLTPRLRGGEVLLTSFAGERSDFVRLNGGRVRQAGAVAQRYLALELIDGRRHVRGVCTLAGQAAEDRQRTEQTLAELRECLPAVPEDPYLLYATEPASTEQVGENRLPPAEEITDAVLAAGGGLDLVGILAAGGIQRGFANSLGQRNWFSSHSFHLDWCLYHSADKAVKTSHAGFEWSPEAFEARMAGARRRLEVLAREPKTIAPGRYRVYLAPAALAEVLEIVAWGGFGLKAHRTKTTSLLKMLEDGRELSPAVTIRENTAGGIAPNFQAAGFVKPGAVVLIDRGRLTGALASPRSAKEYGVATNGANASEWPESLEMTGGDLADGDVLARLGTGVHVSRLWYLNYSDRPSCRITGMTRFATFWVDAGRIVAPLNVMRFDETLYRMLGEKLLALTGDREFIPSSQTYSGRSTDSQRLPGALIEDFTFTL